jgi:hypothetical protein
MHTTTMSWMCTKCGGGDDTAACTGTNFEEVRPRRTESAATTDVEVEAPYKLAAALF